jgi:hypothetical protein
VNDLVQVSALEEWNIREPSRAGASRRGDAGCHSPAWQPERSLREAASRKPHIRSWLGCPDVIPPIMVSNLGNGRRTVPSAPLAGATRPLDPSIGSQRWPGHLEHEARSQTQSRPLGCRSDAGKWSAAKEFRPRVVWCINRMPQRESACGTRLSPGHICGRVLHLLG